MPAGPISKMDFRSNEAGRTVFLKLSPAEAARSISSGRSHSVEATVVAAGASSIDENRKSLHRLYRRAETLSRRLFHRLADQPGRPRPRWRQCRQGEHRTDRTGC